MALNAKTNKSRTQKSIFNVSLGLVNRIIGLLLPFAIRTVMIYTIGVIYLGLDSLFSSILNVLSLTELGFSSAIVYSMYKPIAEKDEKKIISLLNFYKKIYRIVGMVIISFGLILLPNIKLFISKETVLPNDINIYIVYIVLLVNTSISYFLFAYKNSILIADMKNGVDSLFETCRSIVSHSLQILVLLLFKQYYLYIIILPIITVLNNIVRNFYINKKYPHYKGRDKLDKNDKKTIMSRVGALIGNKIGGVVFTSADSIVISSILGLIILGQYTNYFTIYTAVIGVISTIFSSMQSVIGNSLVTESKEKNLELFRILFLVNSIITLICVCCFAALYQPFISAWVGEDNVLDITIPLLLCAFFFFQNIRRIVFVFKEALGMWREDLLKPYVSVLINIALNIFLTKSIGLPGIIISSIIAIVFVEIPWETRVLFKCYFQKKPWKCLFWMLAFCFFTAYIMFITYSKCSLLPYGFIGLIERFLVTIAICSVATIPLLFITNEGKKFLNKIVCLFKK